MSTQSAAHTLEADILCLLGLVSVVLRGRHVAGHAGAILDPDHNVLPFVTMARKFASGLLQSNILLEVMLIPSKYCK